MQDSTESEVVNSPEAAAGEAAVTYQVVVNEEEQYSIWPEYRGEPPAGWSRVGVSGPKDVCLSHINEVWTDMRPRSLREKLAKWSEQAAAESELGGTANVPEDDLVDFLSKGVHPVEASLRPERTPERLQSALDQGFVHLFFTDTRGGTELSVELDRKASKIDAADFATGKGSIHIEGTLEVDFVPVRCVADLDLSTLAGTGALRRLQQAQELEDQPKQ